MYKYLPTGIFMLISAPSWAGSALATTTISTTLTMTSPSALISMTGVSATISATNGYFKNISGTNLTTTNLTATVSGTALTANRTVKAHVVFNGTSPCSIISGDASGCTRTVQGQYGVSLTVTLPTAQYQPICGARGQNNSTYWPIGLTAISQTTTGFRIGTLTISGGVTAFDDANVIDCVIY